MPRTSDSRRTRRLRFETLESRRVLTGNILAEAQEFVYELNVARHDPQAYEDAVGLPNGLLDGIDAQPALAWNVDLTESSQFHADEMATYNYFNHQSEVTGDHPNKMAVDAGYPLAGGFPLNANYIESLAAGTFLTDANDVLRMLILDNNVNPPGHRYHLLATGPSQSFWESHQEIGVGHAYNASAQYRNYWAVHTGVQANPSTFLTGVVFDDANQNDSYDAGEGLSGVTIDVDGVTVTTNTAGGWSLAVENGNYVVTASGGDFVGTSVTQVTVSGDNVEVDFFSGETDGYVNFVATAGPVQSVVVGSVTAPNGQGGGSSPINASQAQAALDEAVRRWNVANAASLHAGLDQLTVEVADLSSGVLAELHDNGVVRLDADAAGWGWFVDNTPTEDEEFTQGSGAYQWSHADGLSGQFDLLSAALQSIGYQLGYESPAGAGQQLPSGVRQLPYQMDTHYVGAIHGGLPSIDNASGTGYVLYSHQPLAERFDQLIPGLGNSQHMIAVVRDGQQWQYDNNSKYVPFTPTDTDILLGEIDFSADTVTPLLGQMGEIAGIRYGYLAGDLVMTADAYGVSLTPNDGEFVVTGTWFQAAANGGIERYDLAQVGGGVAARDNATGVGYMMYSAESIWDRFSDTPPIASNAEHLIAVRFLQSQWHYDNNGTYVPFTSVDSDLLLAQVDFGEDVITDLKGDFGVVEGIRSGYVDGDIAFVANRWGQSFNTGEFGVDGSWFAMAADWNAGESGIAANDNATGDGYLVHSEQPWDTRLNTPFVSGASLNYVAARYVNGQWQADVNGLYVPFSPSSTDSIVAEVDFTADTVVSLAGQWGEQHGMRYGYAYGDIQFVANQWRLSPNSGEFDVVGSHFVPHAPVHSQAMSLLRNGIAARDGATGTGYLMHSEQSIFDRFDGGFVGDQSEHFVPVVFLNGDWLYDNNGSLQRFDPVASDVVLAEIDFAADSIESLEGMVGHVHGLRSGYLEGDLLFFANRWGGSFNSGEFQVEGTYFRR